MKFIEVNIDNWSLTASIPESWNEMTTDQINHVLMVFEAPIPFVKYELIDWKRLQIFKALTGWTDADIEAWKTASFSLYSDENVFWSDLKILIESTTDFMLIKADGEGYNINPELTLNPFPWIKIKEKKGIKKYYGPYSSEGTPLANVTLDELAQIFTAFDDYLQSQDIAHLIKVCAIMYRLPKEKTADNLKRNYDGDIRQPLEDYEAGIKSRVVLFQNHLPEYFLRVIELHIASCRAELKKLYESLFSNSGSHTEGGDWIDFILELADYDLTKKDFIMKQNAHDSLETAVRILRKKKSV